jgi:hypothetical protein
MTELAASTKAAVPQHELDTDAVGILRLPLLQTCSVAHSGHGGGGGGCLTLKLQGGGVGGGGGGVNKTLQPEQ